ncbi:MAG TPA: hypothetical protein VMY37_17105 [Thermoguttaceae bacterium]|nr:hypothetical protein [Thermoguttaceae bacterium]
MPEPVDPEPQPPPPRRRFQFGLGTMLLAAVPISILSAAWAGMMGFGAENSRFPPAFFVLLAAAAPVGVMILFSVCRAVLRTLDESRRRR